MDTMKKLISITLSLFLVFSMMPFVNDSSFAAEAISEEEPVMEAGTEELLSYIGKGSETEKILPQEKDGTTYLFLPAEAEYAALKLAVSEDIILKGTVTGKSLDSDDINGKDADFTVLFGTMEPGKAYPLSLYNGETLVKTITLMKSANLPSMHITLDTKDLSYIHQNKENKDTGQMVYKTETDEIAVPLARLKGRGNSSWTGSGEKRPYNIKLDSKKELIAGAGKAKDWCLLSNNRFDKTGINNHIAYNLYESIAGTAALKTQSIDLYVNHEYRGTYFLTEKVEIKDTRVDITETEYAVEDETHKTLVTKGEKENLSNVGFWNKIPTSGTGLTWVKAPKDDPAINAGLQAYQYATKAEVEVPGGFLLEIDADFYKEASWFITRRGTTIVVKEPEFASKEQLQQIAIYVQEFEDAMYAESGCNSKGRYYGEYIDLDSFVKRFIVDTVMNNKDMLDKSCFFHIDVEKNGQFGKEVLYAGPAWDYDLCNHGSNNFFIFKQHTEPQAAYAGRQEWARAFIQRGDLMEEMTALSKGPLQVKWKALAEELPDVISTNTPSQAMNQVLWSNNFVNGANSIKKSFGTTRYNNWYGNIFDETKNLLGVSTSYDGTTQTLAAEVTGTATGFQWYTIGVDGKKTDIEGATEQSYVVPQDGVEQQYGVAVTGANPAVNCYAGSSQITMYSAPVDLYDGIFVAADSSAGLNGDVRPYSKGSNKYSLYLPGTANTSQLHFTWGQEKSLVVKADGQIVLSGSAPVPEAGKTMTYTIGHADGTTETLQITTMKGGTDVKSMFISTDETLEGFESFAAMQSDSTKETETAGIMTYGEEGNAYHFSMKGRGNWTWNQKKKPYNMTIYKDNTYDKKASVELIDGVKAKKWSLLAGFGDGSLMRNKLAYGLANTMGVGLATEYVDLWVDGEYQGNYLMTPKNDYQAPEEGFVVEIDNKTDNEDPQFYLSGPGSSKSWNRFTVKSNDSEIPVGNIQAYLQEAWDAILDEDSDDYLKYIDLDSFAKFYLLHEFYKDFDIPCGSKFMHRDGMTSEDKLIAGPVWDLDNALAKTRHNGNLGTKVEQHAANGWYLSEIENSTNVTFWLKQLGEHEDFMERVCEMYVEYKDLFENVGTTMDGYAQVLEASAAMNLDRGVHSDTLDSVKSADLANHVHTGYGKTGESYSCVATSKNWAGSVANLKNYAVARASFFDHHILQGEASVRYDMVDGKLVFSAEVKDANSEDLTYAWYVDGNLVEGETGSTYVMTGGKEWRPVSVKMQSASEEIKGTLKADSKQHVLTFDANGGTFADGTSSTIDAGNLGDAIIMPEQPVRDGYTFGGWFADKNLTQQFAETSFSKSQHIYAKWNPITYTIQYEGEGNGAAINPASYTPDHPVTLTQPVRRGYDFLGWTWEGQSVPVKFVTLKRGTFGNKVFIANWKVQVYKVIYTGLAGAENTNLTEYTVETEKMTLQAPVREGYDFLGWTWDDQTKPVMEVTIGGGSRGDKTFTANWKEVQTPDTKPDDGGGTTPTPEPKPEDTSGSLKPTPNTDNQTQTVQPPAAPAKVTTALYGYDDIKVTWSAATGATSYQVYMKKGSGAYKLATTTSSLSYKAKNLADGAKYTFKVVAYNGTLAGGEKASSAIYTLKKVTGVKVVKSGSKVKVSWKNIQGETGYQISKMTTKKGTQKKPTTYKTTKGKYKKLAATKGKTYYYKVRAYKTVNGKKIYGPWSAVKKFKRK